MACRQVNRLCVQSSPPSVRPIVQQVIQSNLRRHDFCGSLVVLTVTAVRRHNCRMKKKELFDMWFKAIATLIVSLLLSVAPLPILADEAKGVATTVLVNASAIRCWHTIIAERTAAPDKRKVVSEEGNRAVLEEKFTNLPVIGHAYMQYEEVATPYTTLEAHLIKSDKFKAFESRWTLSPSVDGKSTSIRLYTYLNTGLWLPFAQQMTNRQTRQDITNRLQHIKQLAESAL